MNSDDESGITSPYKDNINNLSLLNNQMDTDRNEDTMSSNYSVLVPLKDLKGNETRQRAIVTTHTQSVQSFDMSTCPPPISPEENSRLTWNYLSLVVSIIYAVLLLTLGIILHTGNTSAGPSVIYSIFLCLVGLTYLLFLMIDISRYNYSCNALKNQRIKNSYEEGLTSLETPDDSLPALTPSLPPPDPIPLKYCFSQGRHAESFYLKLGAVGFAGGHLVHSILQITVNLGFIFDHNINNDHCLNILGVILEFMLPIYCIVQLYFMFKYSNVIVLKSKCLAYFAFMHMIGSSLCFWILAIARETTLILTIYAYALYGNGNNGSRKYSDEEISLKSGSFINIENLYRENCTASPEISTILENFSPYLYPFTVEFYILIGKHYEPSKTFMRFRFRCDNDSVFDTHDTGIPIAVYYIIWSNIGNYDNDDINSETNRINLDVVLMIHGLWIHKPCRMGENEYERLPNTNEDDTHSNIVIHADCSRSLRGLFAGIILMVVVIGMLILGFVLGTVGGRLQKPAYFLKDGLKLGLHFLMLIAVVMAFNKLRKLDINHHPMSLLDDLLLFICLPAFFMETVLSMVATINIVNVIKCIDVIVMVVQVVMQTPMIMDGLRRCSNSRKLRRSKPGRELLMFLLIANVSMWLFNTFSYKSPESLDERYKFYGKVLWTVLGHISLPLIMFYRFHSSVCLADIWDSAYKPGSDH